MRVGDQSSEPIGTSTSHEWGKVTGSNATMFEPFRVIISIVRIRAARCATKGWELHVAVALVDREEP